MSGRTIVFLFPHAPVYPMGGYKVVYEYANRLCEHGYQVDVVYGLAARPVRNFWVRVAYKALRLFRYLKYRYFVAWQPTWFPLDNRIRQHLRYNFNWGGMPKGDFYVATAWSTAPWVARYPIADRAHKIYFIQSFETWAGTETEIVQTWLLSLTRIVIAPWLLQKAGDLGVDAHLVENGLDQEYFTLENPIESRDPYSVAMLYHPAPLKGSNEGVQAIRLLKELYPNLRAQLFGAVLRPRDLPEWIEYVQKPDRQMHNRIYNEAAIFLAPSHIEGFALTPPEAMLCGAAVCATNIGGYTVVCHDGCTALLSSVGDSKAMAENIVKLIEDSDLRIQLATNALENIKGYTWDRAYQKFIGLLEPAR